MRISLIPEPPGGGGGACAEDTFADLAVWRHDRTKLKYFFPLRKENNAFYFISLIRESAHPVESTRAGTSCHAPGMVK
ncbi:hypothetical protein FFM54_12065 [Burkholderia pseudomallei]|uniref:hypothetical protein n=1 Tax=Burkholderia pseudomallei TaxID=28450 RepID=UPI0001A425F5|nr:hypothetical protein [Burkholderia pseudomallei]EEP50812.1 hypothetical protein GBP346_B0311 [Burkholderia pseudomallei MSHR346]KGS39849.1 hypothetical protein X945_4480 [Burkholderia pseudomallei ABCPW 107]QCU50300.1 hypothetical protein FFM54_12065 [Burkholderia pseudomallei]